MLDAVQTGPHYNNACLTSVNNNPYLYIYLLRSVVFGSESLFEVEKVSCVDEQKLQALIRLREINKQENEKKMK